MTARRKYAMGLAIGVGAEVITHTIGCSHALGLVHAFGLVVLAMTVDMLAQLLQRVG